MLLGAFFSWWYGHGWKLVAESFTHRITGTAELFSVGQISRSLFAPWRRIISYPGASLDDKLRAWADNLFSRCIGFVVRLIVLFGALCTMLVIAVLSILEILAWPFIPLAVPALLVAGAVT